MFDRLKRNIMALCVLSLSTSYAYAIIGNPEAGKQKMSACIECHEADGNTPTALWPKISEFSEAYIYKQLAEFRAGEEGMRNVPLMYNIVKDYSDQDLADLAAYFAGQKRTIGEIPEDQYALGRRIYQGGNAVTGLSACSACHAPNGRGNALAVFPRLSGQNAEYVAQQLQNFRSQERANDINGMMRDVAQRMTDKEIEAVSYYVSGLY